MEIHPALFPDYDTARVLAPDLRSWAGATSVYHPPPYYLALAALDRFANSVTVLRLANGAMALAAFAALLATGFRTLESNAQRMIYAALLVAFPKTQVVSGLINNDNAALLATALALFALVEWQKRPGSWWIAVALAGAGWVKLTALITFAVAFGFLEIQNRRYWPSRLHLAPALGLLVGLIPTLANFVRYGRPLWHGPTFYVPPAKRLTLDLTDYAALFLREMVASWTSLAPINLVAVAGLALIVAVCAYICICGWRRYPVAVALVLALAPTLFLHFYFGWKTYQEDGFTHVAQARYYYTVWPGFALGCAQLWPRASTTVRWFTAPLLGVGLASASLPFYLPYYPGGFH